MDQLILKRSVTVEGRDILGLKSQVILSPNNGLGWVWSVMGVDIPITPAIMQGKRRRVALVHEGFQFNEFEHWGILRAAGLQHVTLWSPRKIAWPPFDGSSLALWQAVIPNVYKEGVLKPYRLPTNAEASLPDEPGRSVSYHGDGNDQKTLRMTGLVEFPAIQRGAYRFGFEYPKDDLLELVRARTLGWPPALRNLSLLACKFGWPHHHRIVWPQEAHAAEVLGETGRHRLLDALAVLNFVAPTGTYLAGAFHTVKGNHRTNVELAKKLCASKVVNFQKKAA